MQISVEQQPKSQVKLTIEITPERTKEFLEQAAKQVSSMVKVPGFRPGNVPFDVLKKHVKDGAIEAHMLDMALPTVYAEAVKKENIKAISRPRIKIIEQDPLKFEALVAIYPEVKVEGYDNVKIGNESVEVSEKDIEEVLKDIQKRHAKYEKVDRPAQKGDRAEIDFEGFDEGGAPLDNTTSKHHPVIIGEGSLVPGFEDKITGMKAGDTKEFEVSFPKDYFHAPFKGKKVKFKVFVHQIDEIKLPEFTPEFIKLVAGEEKSMDELKEVIKSNLKHEKEHNEKNRRENEYLEAVIQKTKVEIPDSLMEEEVDGMIEEFKNELEGKGINLQDYLERTKKEIKDLREQRIPEAEKRLKLRFGLQEIFKKENIEVTEENLKHEFEHIKQLYPETEHAKIEKEYTEGSYLMQRLENKVKMDKLFDKFLA